MAQHDMIIDNAAGATFRADVNAAIQALVTQSSGPIEPTVMYPGMLWLDTSVVPNGLLRQRNQANSGWVTAQGGFAPIDSPILTGNPQAPTPTVGDNDQSIATTKFVHDALGPVDGTANAYEMVNGVWRLAKQTFKPVASAHNIIVPGTAKMAKINANFWLSTTGALAMRLSIDGTTFPAGGTDYSYSGQAMYGGSTANAKLPSSNATYWPMAGSHVNMAMPIHLTALLSVAKTTATSLSVFTIQSRGTAFDNAATLHAQDYFIYGYSQTPFALASQLAAFQFNLTTAATFVAGTVIEVEWVY